MKEHLFTITKKDMNITYFLGKGVGGQHRNRHMNCVRLNHKDSNTLVTGQSHKKKQSNIKEALNNLVKHPKFKLWHNIRVREVIDKKTIEELVEEQMKNIKVEVLNENSK